MGYRCDLPALTHRVCNGRAVAWLNRTVQTSSVQLAIEVSDYVVATFFGGDFEEFADARRTKQVPVELKGNCPTNPASTATRAHATFPDSGTGHAWGACQFHGSSSSNRAAGHVWARISSTSAKYASGLIPHATAVRVSDSSTASRCPASSLPTNRLESRNFATTRNAASEP